MCSSPSANFIPKQVAVTGAAGLVARSILPHLSLKYVERLRLLDLKPGSIGRSPIDPVDLRDSAATLEALRGANAVVHFAIASYGGQVSEEDEAFPNDYHLRMLDVNIKGTYNILEAARNLGIKRVVYISSMTVSMGHGSKSDLNEKLKPITGNMIWNAFVYALAIPFPRHSMKKCGRILGWSPH